MSGQGKGWLARSIASSANAVREAISTIATRVTSVPPPRQPPQPSQPEPVSARLTEKPHQLSLRGWGEVVLILWDKVATNRLFLVAAGVAFYVMLSLVPSITALVWMFGLFADPAVIATGSKSCG